MQHWLQSSNQEETRRGENRAFRVTDAESAANKKPRNCGAFCLILLTRSEWLLLLEVALSLVDSAQNRTRHAHEQALGSLAQATTLDAGTAFAGYGHEILLKLLW
jgi:hypothetical protein